MAVYEHTYQPYTGKLTPERSRFLIIPRYAYEDVFKSRIFAGLFAICFVPVLIEAILIYLHHNTNALAIMNVNVGDLIPINGTFFRVFTGLQESLAFLLTVIVGPALISRDLSNNALPLYLCRPFSRVEYVVGKMSVIVILLSVVTWIPGLLMFIFQSFIEGTDWLSQYLWVAGAILVSSWAWIVILTLLSTSLSALIKWRLAAGGAIFAFFTIPVPISMMIAELFRTRWGFLASPSFMMQRITEAVFRNESVFSISGKAVPTGAAWVVFFLICAMCLLILTRKVRAYEVIR